MTLYTPCLYRGVQAIELSGPGISATVLREFGAKIVSIRNCRTGFEHLWQGSDPVHARPEYDSEYIQGDLSGFDDMFPTINRCPYPTVPWKGIEMPDHGELWTLPWNFAPEGERIHFWTHGVRLPYRFDRWMHIDERSVLCLDYRIENLSPYEMRGIWAAHPLLNIEEGTRIVLPSCVKRIVNTLNLNNRLGKVGRQHDWPKTIDKNGKPYDLSTTLPRDSRVCEKYFNTDPLEEGWAQIVHPRSRESFTFRFPRDRVPYIGVWMNQCGLMNQYNLALEPATGALDDLYASGFWEESGVVRPHGTQEFRLEIEIGAEEAR